MEARFEALGHERFQRFCQSLLSYEHPHLQAFEVGMPDGGRDAAGLGHKESDEYVVFQVKYMRTPSHLEDPLKWIEKIVKEELPKIEELVNRGAGSYQLMTNAVGTPHRDSGSVDKVNDYLREALPVPAECWWRNDLEIRLAKHGELRWGYPELLNPTDILKELVEGALDKDENARRRTLAIRNFLAKQYEDERTVRFKQADLPRNDLLGLFVDVPVETGYSKDRRRDIKARRFVEELARRENDEDFRPGPIGAARVLLHPDAQQELSKVVLEGAPGQGKSTLGQYISQVHRMRLLKKALRGIPAEHRRSPARLPFKIDLRDFAVFLREEDPFASEPEWGGLADGWPRSLEGFLAAHVRLASGGSEFDVSALQAVAETSHLLLVLDGLDEVAEIKDRGLVVDAVLAGCTRLEETALGLQVVVTSRPAAFTNSPALSDQSFRYIALASLTQKLAAEYSSKWTTARGLDRAEATEVEGNLVSQMHKDHIRDLSRNPMQLAILLNLVLTKGKSLPDKRTDLYTRYMDVFFDREAEKSKVVRKHRDTLLALHSHLGWKLHAASELASSGGTISEDDLKLEVGNYLEQEGKEAGLVEHLFRGVVDRIFALVSRVEGRFEFEVQPVREYFAARHLYSTAQLSRVGDERPGTRPDRFDGLVRNSYWLNVVRFYAGFYDAGEQASLADRLEALASDEKFAATDRAWSLAATFLGDWSFSLARQSRERAIDLALAGLGQRHVLSEPINSQHLVRDPAPFALPKGSGLEELGERCWALLEDGLPADRERAIVALLNTLPDEQTLPRIRRHLTDGEKTDRTRRLQIAAQLSATSEMADGEMVAIADADEDDRAARAAALVDAGFAHLVESDEEKSRALVEGLIDGTATCTGSSVRSSSLGLFGSILAEEEPDLLRLGRTPRHQTAQLQSYLASPSCPTAETVAEILEAFFARAELLRFAEPWDTLIEGCRSNWGDGWGLSRPALGVIGRWGRPSSGGNRVDLADPSVPLVHRLRYAITRGGVKGGDWWHEQLGAATSATDRKVALVTATTWPSGAALEQVLPDLERLRKGFKGGALMELSAMVQKLAWNRGSAQSPKLRKTTLESLSPQLTMLLACRDPKGIGWPAFNSRLRNYGGNSEAVLRFCLDKAVARLRMQGGIDDESLLGVVRRTYKALGDFSLDEDWRGYGYQPHEGPDCDLGRKIVADAGAYPLSLVNAAEAGSSTDARRLMLPLLMVAERERWFDQ